MSGAFEAGAGATLLTPSAADANEHVIMRLSVGVETEPPGASGARADQDAVGGGGSTAPMTAAPIAGSAAGAPDLLDGVAGCYGSAPSTDGLLGAYNAASTEPFASHPLVLASAAGPSSGLYGAEAPPLSAGAATMFSLARYGPPPPPAATIAVHSGGSGIAGTGESDGGAAMPHPLARTSGTGMRVAQLLTEFRKKTDAGEWPQSTSVHCHWCCHPFCTVPMGVPVRHAQGKFHVTGCFCSFECAAAHNFASKESPDEVLHRHSLLVALARRTGAGTRVVAAPARETLIMFGGALDIDRFRAHAGSGRVTLVNVPPLQAVTQQAEEVHETDLRGEYKYIPMDTERVTRIQERSRLRRTKPLIDFRYTLDSTMGLKITGTTSTAQPLQQQHFPPLSRS